MSTAKHAAGGPPGAAFYCVADERYFLGAVGMLNSLRIMGHAEPVFLLDCGLRPEQRELLAPHATLVTGPRGQPAHMLKTVAPLAHPAEVVVLIDADMIVTRPLSDLIDRASRGRVVGFRNNTDRFVPEWGQALDLGPIRRGPYVTSGLVLMGGALGGEVLRLLDDRQRRVDYERGFYGEKDPEYPFLYPEQDVLNAILCTRADPARVTALEARLAPTQPFRGLRVLDETALRCAYGDGAEPYVLHHYLKKPWLDPMYHGAYSRLLSRLLLEPDVAVRVPEAEVPLRMRNGLVARLERKRVDVQDLVRWYLCDVIPEWLAGRPRRLRRPAGGP